MPTFKHFPKPLRYQIWHSIGQGLLIIVIGLPFGYAFSDKITVLLSLVVFMNLLFKTIRLFQIGKHENYKTYEVCCIWIRDIPFSRNNQICFIDADESEITLKLSKKYRFQESCRYKLYFHNQDNYLIVNFIGYKWGISAWESNTGLLKNYIIPLIGEKKIQDFTSLEANKFLIKLKTTPQVRQYNRPETDGYISTYTIEKIYKLCRSAFKQAVFWEVMHKNPFDYVEIEKHKSEERKIWTSDMISAALEKCVDDRLLLAINLAFACSLRIGEVLELTWDNINISDEDFLNNNTKLHVEKQLQRVRLDLLEKTKYKGVHFTFPTQKMSASTRLVFKDLKTEKSDRVVWIPRTLALMLKDWKEDQQKQKAFLGSEYHDYNIVVALENGRPCEAKVINKAFDKLVKAAGLKDVDFHSLRHSSSTYKLLYSNGNIKGTQGDLGHATADMTTNRYAKIVDEQRKANAELFEKNFYGNPDARLAETSGKIDDKLLGIMQALSESPELLRKLEGLIAQKNEV